MNTKRFENKVVVVTGAAQGLGMTTAKAFADEGATVIAVGRTASKLERMVETLGLPAIVPFTMDVGVEENWKKLVQFIKDNYGEIDVLVNNAAVLIGKDILEASYDEFREAERVNLDGYFLGMKYCHEVLKKGGNSAIVNISSYGALKVGPLTGNDVAYHATKAAVLHLTHHAAFAFAPDRIRVNAILPAGIMTEMTKAYQKAHPEVLPTLKDAYPLPPHTTEPELIAEAILFLASSSAATITGIGLPIECGAMLI